MLAGFVRLISKMAGTVVTLIPFFCLISHSNGQTAPKPVSPYSLTGDCVTDDSIALQALLDTQRWITLDKPSGGCYLVTKTLVLKTGDVLFGLSANNPNPGDPSAGVVIRMAANRNIPIIRAADSGAGFVRIENIAFDGNGSQQTAELTGQALVDFRVASVQTSLRHVLITRAFGPGLFTGSTQLDNVWIIACSTSTYSWIHNPDKAGLGALMVNQTYVEDQTTPNGGYRDPFQGGAVNDPATFAHAVWLNGLQTGTINQLHCESAATCLDLNDIQSLTIHNPTGTRIGNPSSTNPTDQYLIRALNANLSNLTFTEAYFDQSGSTLPAESYSQVRVFGLGSGVSSQHIYETPQGKTLIPSYTWGRYNQGLSGVPYLGERSIVGNELWIQPIGDNHFPNRLRIWDSTGSPNGSYAYLARDGQHLNLGFSPGPLNKNELTMLQMNFYGSGNPANNVQIPGGRIQTGTQDNTDMVGELSVSNSPSVTYSFLGYYQVHPECSVSPRFDIGPTNRFWITYNDVSSFVVNFAVPVTGSISYTCVGRQ